MQQVTLIEGDGIGPEITAAIVDIFKAAEVPITWERINAGRTVLEEEGQLVPDRLIESIKRNKVALKGPITTPVGKGFKSVNVQMRQMLDLYQNIRPCKTTPGVKTPFKNVDIVIFRENTEGLYSGLEFYDERLQISDSIARITKVGCQNIIRAAFAYAQANGRKKVTVVHKANILKKAGGMFLETAREIAPDYPGIELDDKIVDNMCMQLVIKPEQFDVIVATNLFGDILSDLCAGLVGGLGVVSGANVGDNEAIFEAVHGSAPDIAGKGLANPTALLRSALMMLQHMELRAAHDRIYNALEATLAEPALCTRDLGGEANTAEFTQNIIDRL